MNLNDPRRRVARSYIPLAVATLVFLLMAAVVSPASRAREVYTPTGVAAGLPSQTPGAAGAGQKGGSKVIKGKAGQQQAGTQNGGPGGPAGGVQPCPDRDRQIPGDPYSPPCVIFSGDNGGATFKGVSNDEIIITVRLLEGPSAAEIFADLSGDQSVNTSPESGENTIVALAEYFSKRFNFYGRKLKIVFFHGQGNGSTELLGGGKEQALADAVTAAKEKHAFADISGITIPYADALTQHQVVNIGSPYPSRQWFVDRRPYSWSLFPDGTNVVNASVSWITSRVGPGTTADFAGPAYKGKPRKFAVVAPENQEYQQSVRLYISGLRKAGINVSLNMKYKLDTSTMPNQASNIIAQLKDSGVTSVICGCDPVMLALGLTPKANEQDYEPEWITSGLAFVDQDIVSQLIDSRQWARSFGLAYNADSEPQGRSFPYAAYKSVRPNDEPAFGVEELYYQMYMLALGIQLAGPNLTPANFEAGMFAYPGGSGPRGTWHFGVGDYTPTDDFREIWWNPDLISPQNNKKGAWVELNGGKRYFPGQVPHQPAPYFK